MDVVNQIGFDTVDGGSLSDSWRQQPGTPAYCTELTQYELTKALERANKERATLLRDKVIEMLSVSNPKLLSKKDIVNMNREIYNS